MATPSALQAREVAIQAFELMYKQAEEHRNGQPTQGFHSGHGICDNIPEAVSTIIGGRGSDTNFRYYYTFTNEIKNNFIRLTPSFSGEWGYPVAGDDERSPESAWSYHSNKWTGEYGSNRLTQLRELIALVSDNSVWYDEAIHEQTPARILGFKVGNLYMHKESGELWRLEEDDGSRNPYYRRVSDQFRNCHYFNEMVPAQGAIEKMSVPKFLKRADELQLQKAALKSQIEKLQTDLQANEVSIMILDMALAEQHKVKRL